MLKEREESRGVLCGYWLLWGQSGGASLRFTRQQQKRSLFKPSVAYSL